MKRFILKTTLVCAVVLSAAACKGEKKNGTGTEAAKTESEASVEAASFNVDTTASSLKWMGSKPTGKHHGTVAIDSGVVFVKNGAVESGSFTIDMTTITDEDLEGEMKGNLEAHLKGTAEGKEGDFFNVTKYPIATFTVTGMSEKESKLYLQGNLKIKDKENNIEFPVTTSINGDTMTLESEPFTIDRTNWDVNYGSKSVFDNLGDKWISDDIQLTVMLKADKA